MASIPCSYLSSDPFLFFSPSPSSSGLRSPFLALTRWLGWLRASRMRGKLGPGTAGWRARCWFRFGIDGSQSRDDFDRDDVEQVTFGSFYFLFMPLLAAFSSGFDKLLILPK
ncbi:protein LHCP TRANSLOCATION DEFECT-like [Elaeis guineensis]|uniref:protein LHCP TRANSLOCATION DEFECT-like n=1 Tax=Elaeis guineensis var. tenera TaxID=51953 RepID=UPI003C6CFF45